jgi:acetoacetate decarboxylase
MNMKGLHGELNMKGSFKTAIDNNTTCNMPVHAFCRPFNPNQVSVFGKCSGLSIPFETKEKVLAQYIPDCFEILEPLVDVRFLHCGDVDFLSGSSYNILDVTIPVQFNEKGNKLTGLYPLCMFENDCEAIISGREGYGLPKTFANIADARHVGDHWFTTAGYNGEMFVELNFNEKKKLNEDKIAALNKDPRCNYFGWRVIPNIGKGGCTIGEPTLYPHNFIYSDVWTGEGTVNWRDLGLEKCIMQGMLIHILANIPVMKYLPAQRSLFRRELLLGGSKSLKK